MGLRNGTTNSTAGHRDWPRTCPVTVGSVRHNTVHLVCSCYLVKLYIVGCHQSSNLVLISMRTFSDFLRCCIRCFLALSGTSKAVWLVLWIYIIALLMFSPNHGSNDYRNCFVWCEVQTLYVLYRQDRSYKEKKIDLYDLTALAHLQFKEQQSK